jgi:hypothetical protein
MCGRSQVPAVVTLTPRVFLVSIQNHISHVSVFRRGSLSSRFQFLVSKGEYGFALNNGVPEIYFPGRHVLMSPLADYIGTYKYAAVF